MPDGFRNPFAGKRRRTGRAAPDLCGAPDITLDMAAQFLSACDRFQLPLFALLVFYGLRAAEPCFLFREHLLDGWLKIGCIPALAYLTKGRRDKRVPIVEPLAPLFAPSSGVPEQGLLFLRREVLAGRHKPPLIGSSLPELQARFEERCRAHVMAQERIRLRDHLLRDAGALRYDDIQHEFHKLARNLGWPAGATLKDFRHLFASTLESAGMPEYYRRYLMGHAPGRAAIVTYTHLSDLREHYEEAIHRRLGSLVEATSQRGRELGLC
jgi:integrase